MNPVKMNSGTTIPPIALGLWQVRDRAECATAVEAALDTGYRHFDTAQAYGNEAFLGETLKRLGEPRDSVFITTKISTQNIAVHRVDQSFAKSLQNLQTDYVDLILLHFPVTLARKSAWKKLEAIHKDGRAKAIGVSNFTIRHLEELLNDGAMTPAVNQVELHVYLQQPELLAYCKEKGIVVEAYSPLAHGQGMDDTVLAELAKKHHKTPAQIMLRWCIDIGTVPLPKSVHAERIKENFDIFDFKLSSGDMAKLKALNRDYRTCWDPSHVP